MWNDGDTEAPIFFASSAAATSAAVRAGATSKVTIAQRRAPAASAAAPNDGGASRSVSPGIFAKPSLSSAARAHASSKAVATPTSSRTKSQAAARPARPAIEDSHISYRAAVGTTSYDRLDVQRTDVWSTIGGSPTRREPPGARAPRRAYRKPVPRGPRSHLRPVAARKSQPSASTSSGRMPAVWHASSM